MRTGKGWTTAAVLGLALASASLTATVAAARPHAVRTGHASPSHADGPAMQDTSRHAGTAGRSARRPVFRPQSRMAAAHEAARLGAAAGNGCHGKADLARNDHEWVVLCSNGKTYVVDMPAQNAGAPAVECSLAGIGPQPACFRE